MSSYSYGIDFFSDELLETEVQKVLIKARGKSEPNPYKNVIDPYAALLEAAALNTELTSWVDLELSRQENKRLTNAIGDFHQTLLGNLPGWESTGSSGGLIDLKHEQPFGTRQTPVLAEVKNKYNTMNSGSAADVFTRFQKYLSIPEYKHYTCYLVQVIQKSVHDDVPWVISQRGKQENIRLNSAAKVYELSTGDKSSFPKLFSAVRQILEIKHGMTFDAEDLNVLQRILNGAPSFRA